MHLTINVEHGDLGKPHNLRLLAQALLVLAGEKPNTETIEVRVDATGITAELDKTLAALKANPPGNRMAGEGPVALREELYEGAATGIESVSVGAANFVHLTGSNESVEPATDDRRCAAVIGDLPPQDDPAAILAAAQAGGAPLGDPAVVPSGAVAAPSTTAPADTTATSTELDASGLPWDERIHASSHAKVANGCWRKRSKLADGVYETVEAELRIHYPKPAPALPPPPPSGAAGGGSEFAALVERLHAGFRRESDPVTKQQQVDAMKHFGLNGLEDLSKRPDLFEAFSNMLGI